MARSRTRFLGNQINSRKNIVQSINILSAATQLNLIIVDTVDTMPAIADTDGVTAGAKINTVYIEAWFYGNAVAGINSPLTWALVKSPGANLVIPDPATAGSDDNKRWIFAMGKGLLGNSANGQPGYLIRGWFSIPKRMRRFGHDDQLILAIKNDTANDVNICRIMVYKWYY